ncbi:MAG: molybdate ABC transporter substrate-binding protein [Parvibaculaceae bacterium]|nr:molybdate ABC transporter substrate-binding protein [Parvibaculaceae bacterium]
MIKLATQFVLCATALLYLTGTAVAKKACEPISIFAAASTTEATQEVADLFERQSGCSVSTIFASSATLARQIAAGAPADLYLSANKNWMDWLIAQNTVLDRNARNYVTNQLVIITPAKNSVAIDLPLGPQTLLPNSPFAIAEPNSVPAGIYGAQSLKKLGLWGKLKGNLLIGSNVRTVLAWVSQGEAKLGITYATDAQADPSVRIAARIPAHSHDPIIYPLALIGERPTKPARAFYAWLQTHQALSIFADHGFALSGAP